MRSVLDIEQLKIFCEIKVLVVLYNPIMWLTATAADLQI